MLNKRQQAAVQAPLDLRGVCSSAGPGTGKTFTMVHRLQYLLEQGVPEDQIIVVTLTQRAAGEMWQRIVRAMPQLEGSVLERRVCTIHALNNRIWRRHTERNWKVIDVEYKVLQDQLDEIVTAVGFGRWYDIITNDVLFAWINASKAEGYETEVSRVYFREHLGGNTGDALYEARLKFDRWCESNGYISFADMLLKVDLLLREPAERRALSGFYVIVDEGQDTGRQAMRILRTLAEGAQIWMVGDLNQTLFEFAGAHPDVNIGTGFDIQYPDGERFPLTVNYRSTRNIIETANRLCEHSYYED